MGGTQDFRRMDDKCDTNGSILEKDINLSWCVCHRWICL